MMNLRETLIQLGALAAAPGLQEVDSERIIPALLEFWTARADSTRGPSTEKARRISAWLKSQLTAGAVAEFVRPVSRQSSLESAFGERLVWWPRGKPLGRRIVIASSRIGRKLHERPQWFETLRLATATLENGDSLLTSPGTTTHRFVSRLAELLDLSLVELRFATSRLSAGRWFEWLLKEAAKTADQRALPVFVSPPLATQNSASDHESGMPDRGVADRDVAVSLLADQTWVLSLRKNGHLQTLLSRGLAESVFSPGTVRLLLGEGLVDESQAQPMQDLGAVAWYLSATGDGTQQTPSQSNKPLTPRAAGTTIDIDGNNWSWLTHCTREAGGAWPDETQSAFVDEALLSEATDRSSRAALLRILTRKKLLASGKGIRGEFPVVCFSARPLRQLLKNRIWQRHRTRWDFEPFGICIRRPILEQLGARPVAYGDDENWKRLPKSEQPWFQKSSSQIGAQSIDWSAEQEWRVLGNLDLSQLGSDDAFVFVPTEETAREIRLNSRWPVIVVHAGSQDCQLQDA